MPYSVFDIAGPIMVGPSSSHTAGACKIGQVARALFKGSPKEAIFHLYGSFATVYQGHATDRALLAGAMKMQTSDPNIKYAFEVAEEKKLKYKFIAHDILTPEHHPNTVRIILKNNKRTLSVVGSSIGGGQINITHINNIPIDLSLIAGRFFSLVIGYNGKESSMNELKDQLKKMRCITSREQSFVYKNNQIHVIEIENHFLKLSDVLSLEKIDGIDFVRSLTKLLKK